MIPLYFHGTIRLVVKVERLISGFAHEIPAILTHSRSWTFVWL
jgi:hypothetical protein